MKPTRLTTWALFLALLLTNTAAQDEANINIIPKDFYAHIPACGSATFHVDLINTGTEAETYHLSILHLTNETTIDPADIILPAQTTQPITITTTLKDCTITGQQTITLRAITDTTQLQLDLDLTLDISTQGVPLIAPDINLIRTTHKKTSASLPIKNQDTEPLRFTTKLIGEPWMNIQQTTLPLNPDEQKSLILILEPTTDIPEGNYLSTITLSGQNKEYKKTITIQLNTPTSQSFTYTTITALFVILGIIVLFFTLRHRKKNPPKPTKKQKQPLPFNKHEYREQRRAERRQHIETRWALRDTLKKINDKKKSEQHITEQPTKKNSTEQELKKELLKTHFIIPKTSVVQQKKKSYKTILLTLLFLTILATLSGTSYIIPSTRLYTTTGLGTLTILYLLRTIYLTRRRTLHIPLIVANEHTTLHTGWHTGLHTITLTPTHPLKNLKITLTTNRKNAPKHTQANIYTYTTFNTNFPEHINETTTTLTLPTIWLKKQQATPQDLHLWQWNGNTWREITIQETTHHGKNIHITANIKPGTLAIGIRRKNKTPTRSRLSTFIGYTSLALLTLLTTLYLTSLTPEQKTPGIPQQTWPQNTEHTINLTPYFTDPDGDKLIYTATPVQNIKVKIINGHAILNPDEEFTGTRDVIFTAKDNKNGKATSNTVKLTVTKNYIPPHLQPYTRNILIITAIILVLITITAFRTTIKRFLES